MVGLTQTLYDVQSSNVRKQSIFGDTFGVLSEPDL